MTFQDDLPWWSSVQMSRCRGVDIRVKWNSMWKFICRLNNYSETSIAFYQCPLRLAKHAWCFCSTFCQLLWSLLVITFCAIVLVGAPEVSNLIGWGGWLNIISWNSSFFVLFFCFFVLISTQRPRSVLLSILWTITLMNSEWMNKGQHLLLSPKQNCTCF